jgi:hypothetical protein
MGGKIIKRVESITAMFLGRWQGRPFRYVETLMFYIKSKYIKTSSSILSMNSSAKTDDALVIPIHL